jgi:Raf kinase inhibitor-like YbhB/YbcL family protein
MSTRALQFSRTTRFFSLGSLVLFAACSSSEHGGATGMSSGGASTTGGMSSGGSPAATGGSTAGSVATGGSTGGTPTATGGTAGSGAATSGGSNGGSSTSTGGVGTAGGSGASGNSGSSAGGKSATSGAGGATAGGGGSTGNTGGATSGTFTVTSPSWVNMPGCAANMSASCADLPTEITRSGAGTSPELHWSGAPAGTMSFAVVLQDLSGGSTHWVIWNIPGTVTALPANVDRTTAMPATPGGSQQCGKGTDAATKYGYIGPGAPCNVYEFMVYALSVSAFTPTSTTDPAMVRTQLNGLATSTLLGTASLRGRTNMTCK